MKKTSLRLLLIILWIGCSIGGNAKNIIEQSEHKHKHNHEENREEIGIGTGPFYLVGEEEWVYGFHLHYVARIFESPKWGVGFGYERLFDDHQHNFFGVIGAYNPIEHLALTLAPGMVYEAAEKETAFAIHLETVYEYELGRFHLGPVVGCGYSAEDIHLSVGLHFAYAY